jgi:hypothetical protein
MSSKRTHALDDFERLRHQQRDDEKLWHSLSHHLRHAVFRIGREVPSPDRRWVRRHGKP